MVITNTTAHDDRLVGASSAVAGVMQVRDGDGRRHHEDARAARWPASPGRRGGDAEARRYHVMFMGLEGPLVPGREVDVTLKFEGRRVSVPLVVLAPDAEGLPEPRRLTSR